MQCPSCKFENMPGITSCGRCGSNLAVQTMTLDVHPPRATKWQKSVRNALRVYSRPSAALSMDRLVWWEAVEASRVKETVTTGGVLIRLIFPGWAQRYLGFPKRGLYYSTAYIFFIITGLLFIGSFLGAFFFLLAIAIHGLSCFELLSSDWDLGLWHWFRSVALVLLMMICGYLTLTIGLYTYIQVITMMTVAPPLERGDVLIARAGATPQVGDVVVYELPRVQTAVPGRLNVWQGERVDRILAGPGQKVSLKDGKLLVDDATPQFSPLNPVHFSATVNVQLGTNEWFILPSTDTTATRIPVAGACVVNQNSIQGVVLFRSYPYWRWGRITSIE